MPSSATSDAALLARLNALKKSTVSLSTEPPLSPSIESSLSASEAKNEPQTLDLAARFARLGGMRSRETTPEVMTKPTTDISLETEHRSAVEHTLNVEGANRDLKDSLDKQLAENEKSIDDVLRDLGPLSQYKVTQKGRAEMARLEREEQEQKVQKLAKRQRKRLRGRVRGPGEAVNQSNSSSASDGSEIEEEALDSDEQDEIEADEYVAQVLAELEVEGKYRNEDRGQEQDQDKEHPLNKSSDAGEEAAKVPGYKDISEASIPKPADRPPSSRSSRNEPSESEVQKHADDENHLNLPSAPTTLPDDFAVATAVDDLLTSRMAALSLPSAPSFSPSKKPVNVSKHLEPPKYTEDEVASWCVICCDDGEIKCLGDGCEGDAYCRRCWREGHRGKEQKGHKWVNLEKKR